MNNVFKRLWISKSSAEKNRWKAFLTSNGIRAEDNVDFTLGVFESNNLVATGSIFQNIIKCVAISPEYHGGSVFNALISRLISEINERGYNSIYVYTKPESTKSFEYLGFTEIARVSDQLVFLEKANIGFNDYLELLESYKTDYKIIGSIVMNANPFTKGHQYLAEYGAAHCDMLNIFVLSEDLSAFPREVRIKLVKDGTAHLKNVNVHPTGDYMVSAKTFPAYFLKEDADITSIQAELDARVFLYIAKVLGINKRFVGEEPHSIATNLYNEAMTKVFENKIDLTIIPRKELGGEVISASRVRQLLLEDDILGTKEILPPTTYDFLQSPEGIKIKEKIKKGVL